VFAFDQHEYEQDDVAGVTLPRGTRTYNPSTYPDTVMRWWE
jgi:hypothetical protein